ncbi:MAG: hypothetical protein LQ340_002028 [Diploschistes diacapsis]|nr:MAG: hypothetical protein LQ340_002028 [Diploschistes diacapsis]
MSDHEFSLQATHAEKQAWKGWCEIESEPAFFNMILKQFGVRGVKVCEIFSFDEDMLESLPKPVYGLIFLSKWRENKPLGHSRRTEASQGIWFANQTVDNACATLALLNIINNVEGIELGEHLAHFREFTNTFAPELRGEAVGNFEFARQIHNSFARFGYREYWSCISAHWKCRKMDMLNSDLYMADEAYCDEKSKSKHKKRRHNMEEAAYHFDAFILIKDEIWKLDGLEAHPQSLGTASDSNWVEKVKLDLQDRMASYEANAVEFATLGVARDPLHNLTLELAKNIQEIKHLDACLDVQFPNWRKSLVELSSKDELESTLSGPNESYRIREDMLDSTTLPTVEEENPGDAVPQSLDELLQSRVEAAHAQANIRASIAQEWESNLSDEIKCQGRKFDYSPIIYDWFRFHVGNGTMKDIIDIM